MRLLILGGTFEARALAEHIAVDGRIRAVLSLAGRTKKPLGQAVQCRTGDFGGVDGLVNWLKHEKIDAIVDATHPYAAQISRNAVAAARICGLPLGSIVRAPWERVAGDQWSEVPDIAASVEALGQEPKNVFLTVGRMELSQFAGAPQHTYLARTIDPPGDVSLPPKLSVLTARGPFDVEGETQLMTDHGIDVLVTKNSGGAATYAKIIAARALGLDVVMIARPEKPCGEALRDVVAAVAWIDARVGHHATSVSDRGV